MKQLAPGVNCDVVKRFSLFLFAVFALAPNYARSAGLVDVYQMALQHDPKFQAVGYQKMAVGERKRQAVAKFLPIVSGSFDYTKTYQDLKSVNNAVVAAGAINYESASLGLDLNQPVFHRDSWVGLKKADTEIELTEVRRIFAEQDLIVRVAERYFNALHALDQKRFVMAEQAAVEKHFELASGRFHQGLIPITDLHDAKARKVAVLAKSIEAQNIYDDAMQALEEITGTPLTAIRSLKGEMELARPDPDDMESWLEIAKQNSPAVLQQIHAVDIAELEVERQDAGHWPTVDLVGNFETKDSNGSIYGGGTDGHVANIMLMVNMPLYEGGAVLSRVREKRYVLSEMRQELIRVERAVARQTRSAYLGVNSSLRQVEALKQAVVFYEMALEAKRQGFMSGLYTSLNVLDAERDLALANIDFSKARYSYLLNKLKLKMAVGSLQESDLKSLEKWLE